jgi:ADP-glucose pyrophosphorylase
VESSLVAEGCAVLGAGARRAVLDKGAVIPPGARIEYDAEADRRRRPAARPRARAPSSDRRGL